MESLKKLNPHFYKEVEDAAVGLKGFVVIDSCLNGNATGGIRMAENVTLEEVANLAHEMTLKFAFLNIKKDGAKAGIVAPPKLSDEKKKQLCNKFGKAIDALIRQGTYSPGEDLGTNSEDLAEIFSGAGFVKEKNIGINSGHFTALTVFLSAKETLKAYGQDLRDSTVIIEGFGKVAEHLADMFFEGKARIIGISTIYGGLYDENGLDVPRLRKLKQVYGDHAVRHYDPQKTISKEELFFKKTDILVPGARPDSISCDNLSRIQAKFIVPIANIAATEDVEKSLFERRIIYVPGFVSNSGGILGYFLQEQGFRNNEIEEIMHYAFSRKINRLTEKAESRACSISTIARQKAQDNLRGMAYENISIIRKLSLRRFGWIAYKILLRLNSGFVLKGYAKHYIKRKLLN